MSEENKGVDAGASPRTSNAQQLLQLAERCEQEEPSLALSVRIFLALNDPEVLVIDDTAGRFPRPHRHVRARSIWNEDWPHWGNKGQVEGIARELDCLDYTSSLDAAVTLVPEGAVWLRKSSEVMTIVLPRASEEEWARHIDGWGKTPALAVCSAALRARAGEMT